MMIYCIWPRNCRKQIFRKTCQDCEENAGITCFFSCTNWHCSFVDNFSPVFCKETIKTSKKRASFTVRVISMGSSRKRYHGGEKCALRKRVCSVEMFLFFYLFLRVVSKGGKKSQPQLPGKDYFPHALRFDDSSNGCLLHNHSTRNEC